MGYLLTIFSIFMYSFERAGMRDLNMGRNAGPKRSRNTGPKGSRNQYGQGVRDLKVPGISTGPKGSRNHV